MRRFVSMVAALAVMAAGVALLRAGEDAPEEESKVKVLADVPFLPEAKREAMRLPTDTTLPGEMDIYLPAGRKEGQRSPAVVIVHGGGWGNRWRKKGMYVTAGTKLAEAGFVAASIDYTLAPMNARGYSYLRNMASSFPQNLKDVKSAIRFLRRNADRYGIDPDRIAILGASAGGHLAALAAVTQPKDGFEPTDADDGLGDVSSAVQACIPYYGVFDWSTWGGNPDRHTAEELEKAKQASPINHLDKDDPPMLVFHGDRDRTVPYAQSVKFVERLKALGIPHQFVTFEGKGHSICYTPSKSGMDDHAVVVEFLKEHLAKPPAPPAKKAG